MFDVCQKRKKYAWKRGKKQMSLLSHSPALFPPVLPSSGNIVGHIHLEIQLFGSQKIVILGQTEAYSFPQIFKGKL
jgi:hypothetical protein